MTELQQKYLSTKALEAKLRNRYRANNGGISIIALEKEDDDRIKKIIQNYNPSSEDEIKIYECISLNLRG